LTVPNAEDHDAIRRDDVLLDALAGRRAVGEQADGDPAARLLAALVDDVWSEPIHDQPEPCPPHGKRLRRFPRTVVALSVTTVVLATTGVAAAAADFSPFSFDGGGSSIGEDRTHPHFQKDGPGLAAERRDQPAIPTASGARQSPLPTTSSGTPSPSASSTRPQRHGGGSGQGASSAPDPSSPSSPVTPSPPTEPFGTHNDPTAAPQSSPSAQPSDGQAGSRAQRSPHAPHSSGPDHTPSAGVGGDRHLSLLRLARYGHTFTRP
jgi:hypothetical protein